MFFEFATATRIVFGAGTSQQLARETGALGNRALVVTGACADRHGDLLSQLRDRSSAAVLQVGHEPSVEVATEGLALARAKGCDVVVGLGGGSAIDSGKAIAALLTNPGDPVDYLEVVGRGQPLIHPPAPFIAVPTTAGTGAEVTRNAVLAVPEKRVKVSLRSAQMLPRLALIDPLLTLSLPPEVTASTGLDALTQVLEPFVCNKTNPLTDAICETGLRLAAKSLMTAYRNGADKMAREDMAQVSLFGGLALANAKLGAAHGFAGPIGGMYNAPHGVICAALLPHVMAANVKALQQRKPQSPILTRYQRVAGLLTGKSTGEAAAGVDWIHHLCHTLRVPRLKTFGIKPSHYEDIVDKAGKASSMQGNPIELTRDELLTILKAACE